MGFLTVFKRSQNPPRGNFVFLDDFEALEAVAECSRLGKNLDFYTRKLFPHISTVNFSAQDVENPLITSVSSRYTNLNLKRVIRMRRVGCHFFEHLEREVAYSIREAALEAMRLEPKDVFSETRPVDIPTQVITAWINSWTNKYTHAALEGEQSRRDLDTFLEVLNGYIAQLQTFHKQFNAMGDDSKKLSNWIRINSMQSSLINGRGFVKKLIDTQALSTTDFLLFMKPKTKVSAHDKRLEWSVDCGDVSVPYEYEFTGDTWSTIDFFVDGEQNCYGNFKLFNMYHTYMIADEDSTLHFSRSFLEVFNVTLGKHFIVRSPSHPTGKTAILRLLHGCMKSGAFLLFEGVHKMSTSDLQLVASFVSIAFQAISRNFEHITFQDVQVKAARSFCFVCTVESRNRGLIPPSIHSNMRTLYFGVPDFGKVVDLVMANYNLQHHNHLRDAIFSRVTSQVQDRNSGHIFAAASNLVLQLYQKLDNTCNFQTFTESLSSNNFNDLPLLESKYKDDVFQNKLENCIGERCKRQCVQAAKVLEIHRSLETRRAALLLGPSCSGKTSSCNVLSEVLTSLKAKDVLSSTNRKIEDLYEGPVKIKGENTVSFSHLKANRKYPLKHYYFPGALSLHFLYGGVEGSKGIQFRDGLFQLHMRQIFEDPYLNTRQEHEIWFIFDGRIEAPVLEILRPLLDEKWEYITPKGVVKAIKPSLLPKLIVETTSMENLSPVSAAKFAVVNFTHKDTLCSEILEDWYEKLKVSIECKHKSHRRTNLLTLLESIKDLFSEFPHVKNLHAKFGTHGLPCTVSLFNCLNIINTIWGISSHEFIDSVTEGAASTFYFTSLVWGIGAASEASKHGAFNRRISDIASELNFDELDAFNEVYFDDEEFDVFSVDLLFPTTPKTNQIERPKGKSSRKDIVLIFDKMKQNTLLLTSLMAKAGNHFHFSGTNQYEKREFIGAFCLHAQNSHVQKFKVAHLTLSERLDLEDTVVHNFSRHSDVHLSGFQDKSVMLVIEDFAVNDDEPREVLRALLNKEGFYDRDTLLFNTVDNFSVVLSLESTQQANDALPFRARLLKHFQTFDIRNLTDTELSALFQQQIRTEMISKSFNSDLLMYMDEIMDATCKFHRNFVESVSPDFETCLDFSLLLRRGLSNSRRLAIVNQRKTSSNCTMPSFLYKWWLGLAQIYGGINGIDAKEYTLCIAPSFEFIKQAKVMNSPAAQESQNLQADYDSRIEFGQLFLEAGHERSFISVSPYVVSISKTLLHHSELVAIATEKHDVLLLCDEQTASFEFLVEMACMSVDEMKIHTAHLGPLEDAKNTDIVMQNLANAIIDANSDDVDTVVMSVVNVHFIDDRLLLQIYKARHGLENPNIFSPVLIAYIGEAIGEDFDSIDDFREVQTNAFKKMILVVQVPFAERCRLSMWTHCKIFNLFHLIRIPRLKQGEKREIVVSILEYRIGDGMPLQRLRKLSETFVQLDGEMANFQKDNLITLLESVDAFCVQYNNAKARTDMEAQGINAGMRQLMLAKSTENSITLETNTNKQNIEESHEAISNLEEAIQQCRTELAQKEPGLIIQREVFKTLQHAYVTEVQMIDDALFQATLKVQESKEKIRRIAKADLARIGLKTNPTSSEMLCMTAVMLILHEKKPNQWEHASAVLQDPRFQSRLLRLNHSDRNVNALKHIKKFLSQLDTDADLDENLECLVSHVRVIIEFIDTKKEHQPLITKKEMLRRELDAQSDLIESGVRVIEKIKEDLETNTANIVSFRENLVKLEEKSTHLRKKYAWCLKAVKWLQGKESAWKDKLNHLHTVEIPSILPSSFISFGCLAYACAMNPDEKAQLKLIVTSICDSANTETIDMPLEDVEFGGMTDIEMHDMQAAGMPLYFTSSAAAIDMLHMHAVTVFLDPQNFALLYIHSIVGVGNVIRTFANDKALLSKLEAATSGGSIIVIDCEQGQSLPSDVWSLICCNSYHGLGNTFVLIDNKKVNVSPGFRVFIRFYKIPEWYKICCHQTILIDFSPRGQRSTFDSERQDLLISITQDILEKKKIEDRILSMLAGSNLSALCENETFIKHIEHSMSTELMLHERLRTAQAQLGIIHENDVQVNMAAQKDDAIQVHTRHEYSNALSLSKKLLHLPRTDKKALGIYVSVWKEEYACTEDQIVAWVFRNFNSQEEIICALNDDVLGFRTLEDTLRNESNFHLSIPRHVQYSEKAIYIETIDHFFRSFQLGYPTPENFKCFGHERVEKELDVQTLIDKFSSAKVRTKRKLRTRASLKDELRRAIQTGKPSLDHAVGPVRREMVEPTETVDAQIVIDERDLKFFPELQELPGMINAKKAVAFSVIKSFFSCNTVRDKHTRKREEYRVWNVIVHLMHWNILTSEDVPIAMRQIQTEQVLGCVCSLLRTYFVASKAPINMRIFLMFWARWYSGTELFHNYLCTKVNTLLSDIGMKENGDLTQLKKGVIMAKLHDELFSVILQGADDSENDQTYAWLNNLKNGYEL